MAPQDVQDAPARDQTHSRTVGHIPSGWFAAHACGWIETGLQTRRGAARLLERHIAFVCVAPTCHHP